MLYGIALKIEINRSLHCFRVVTCRVGGFPDVYSHLTDVREDVC